MAHQLNPVDVGLSLFLPRSRVPLVLGTVRSLWPPARDRPAGHSTAAHRRPAGGGHAHRASRPYSSAEPRCCCSRLAPPRERLHRPGRARVRVLPYGIDVGSFEAPADAGAEEDGPILFLAGLEPWKGIDTLLDAFELMAGKFRGPPPGDRRRGIAGPARARARGRLRRWDRANRRARSCGARLMSRSLLRPELALLPSLRARALRDQRAGGDGLRPTRGGHGRRRPGPPGGDEEGGRLVPPGDAPALAAALRELLSARRRCAGRWASATAASVGERYAWGRVVARLEDAYREAIALARLPGDNPSKTPSPVDRGPACSLKSRCRSTEDSTQP